MFRSGTCSKYTHTWHKNSSRIPLSGVPAVTRSRNLNEEEEREKKQYKKGNGNGALSDERHRDGQMGGVKCRTLITYI